MEARQNVNGQFDSALSEDHLNRRGVSCSSPKKKQTDARESIHLSKRGLFQQCLRWERHFEAE